MSNNNVLYVMGLFKISLKGEMCVNVGYAEEVLTDGVSDGMMVADLSDGSKIVTHITRIVDMNKSIKDMDELSKLVVIELFKDNVDGLLDVVEDVMRKGKKHRLVGLYKDIMSGYEDEFTRNRLKVKVLKFIKEFRENQVYQEDLERKVRDLFK